MNKSSHNNNEWRHHKRWCQCEECARWYRVSRFDCSDLGGFCTYMTCDQFRHEMRQRNHVERIISALVNHNDARRARGRGTAATDFQIKMAASAYNTKKLLRKIQIDPPLG